MYCSLYAIKTILGKRGWSMEELVVHQRAMRETMGWRINGGTTDSMVRDILERQGYRLGPVWKGKLGDLGKEKPTQAYYVVVKNRSHAIAFRRHRKYPRYRIWAGQKNIRVLAYPVERQGKNADQFP